MAELEDRRFTAPPPGYLFGRRLEPGANLKRVHLVPEGTPHRAICGLPVQHTGGEHVGRICPVCRRISPK